MTNRDAWDTLDRLAGEVGWHRTLGMQDASTRTIITRKASMYTLNGTTISRDGKPIAELLEGVELEAVGILVSKANGFDKDEALLDELDDMISRRNDP